MDRTGQRFATAGDDGFVKLWSLSGLPTWVAGAPPLENVPAQLLTEHDGFAKCVAFSPDGKWVASGAYDKTICIAAVDGSTTNVIPVGDDLNALIFSADGKLVLAAGRASKVQAFDTSGKNPKPIWILDKAHSTRINDITLMPDAAQFITAGDDGAIRVWSMKDQELMLTVEHESAAPAIGKKEEVKFLGVAVSDDGQLIAGGQSDGKVSIWKNKPSAAKTLADLRGPLSQRVHVWWDQGELKPRSN